MAHVDDRRDNRPPMPRGTMARLAAKLDAERWERCRVNSENIARWEACQIDPCRIHGHGPSTDCVR